ncbi:hypothetical protein KUTeg_014115 [Tegillarca granosa]|uniref:ABC transmembrane type-1 domain-containing protein n=1 Tax=Tegillarca granosa TaxID=220873 RepID=A0ABQ9EY65_TEGGR|nr:hypothetical protein KUTeg_014115 [Tegillarca granosa]
MLISYIQNKSNEYAWKGYVLAFSFYINAVVMYLVVYYNDINVDTLMMKLKSCLISAVYKKIVKFYTWESSFQKKITDIRNKELSVTKHFRYLNASYVLTLGLVPFLVSLVSFIIFIFYQEGNHLDAGKAFTALSLFDNLKFPLFMLPRLITRFVQVCIT